jgi:hypothetical protein
LHCRFKGEGVFLTMTHDLAFGAVLEILVCV